MRLAFLLASVISTSALTAPPAHAWQIESVATNPCHERITAHALARAGFPGGAEPPPVTDYEDRIIQDVPFSFPGDDRDAWRLALLIGVRDNDIGSEDPTDVAALSRIHNNPSRQDEHCLRHREDDGLAGNAAAAERCKVFIMAQLELALGDDDTLVDLDATIGIEVNLKFRDRQRIRVQRYGYHTGRALHALQDSYTHMFRNPETAQVRTVLNWIEGNIDKNWDEDRDGHEHIGAVDDCSRTDAESKIREDQAEFASALLLGALADDTGGRSGRLARAQAVLDEAFVEEPDCTLANDYCGASELTISGCAVGGSTGLASLGVVALLLARRRRRRGTGVAATGVALFGAALLLVPATARAQAGDVPSGQAPGPAPAPTTAPPKTGDGPSDEAAKTDAVEEKVLEREDKVIAALPDPTTQTWGAALNIGGAFDRGAVSASAGIRYNPSPKFGVGLDVEYNPWISYSEIDIVAGVVNVYVPLIWKLRTFGSWELRTTFALGASVMLTNLVEADAGSVGVFAGWNPLGVAVSIGADWKLVVKPGDIAVPVPVLTGFPFYYHQYRFSIGLEWYP